MPRNRNPRDMKWTKQGRTCFYHKYSDPYDVWRVVNQAGCYLGALKAYLDDPPRCYFCPGGNLEPIPTETLKDILAFIARLEATSG